MKKIPRTLLLFLLVFVVMASGCGTTKKELVVNQVKKPLKITMPFWIGNGIFYVAEDKGFFAAEKVAVEVVDVNDAATGRQLVQTAQVDAFYFTPETVGILNDGGVAVKIIAAGDLSFGADGIIATKNIQKIEDLKGKKVAFEIGSPSHFLLSVLLNQVGLTTKDLEVVEALAPDAGAAFVAGKVDAAVSWEPWLTKASERAGGHLLASSRDIEVVYDMPIFREEIVVSRPEDIKAMLRALFAAQKWIAANPSEAAKIIATHLNITPDDALEQMKGVHWLSYEENVAKLTDGDYSVKKALESASDLWIKLGLITTPLETAGLIDTSFVTSLYHETASTN